MHDRRVPARLRAPAAVRVLVRVWVIVLVAVSRTPQIAAGRGTHTRKRIKRVLLEHEARHPRAQEEGDEEDADAAGGAPHRPRAD